MIWSNRGKCPPPAEHAVSLAALPSWLIRQAGLPLPPFLALSANVFQDYPIIRRNMAQSVQGDIFNLSGANTPQVLRDYRIICQDLLLGENYTAKILQQDLAD